METSTGLSENRTPVADDAAMGDDVSKAAVAQKAAALCAGLQTDETRARAIVGFVRDEILFGFADAGWTPAMTLQAGAGSALTKSRLQVQLLAEAGIAARFHLAEIRPDALTNLMPELATGVLGVHFERHVWVECLLDNRWIGCDTLLDRGLFGALLRRGMVTRSEIPTIQWDGRSDLNVLSGWVTEDLGPAHEVDPTNPVPGSVLVWRPAARVVSSWMNRHLKKLRA